MRGIFKLQRIAYDRRRYSLTLVGIFVIFIGWAYQSVQSSNDPMLFFGAKNEHRQKLMELQAEFGTSQQSLIVLRSRESGAPLDLLEAERYLTQTLQAKGNPISLLDVTKVGSATSILPALGYPLEYTPLEDVQYLAADHPGLREYYFNDDLSATVIIVSQNLVDQSDFGLQRAYSRQQLLVDHVKEKFPSLDVFATGNVSMFEALRQAFEFDQKYLFPATVVANFLILLFAFGNLRLTVGVLLIAVTAVVLTRGIAGWSGYVFASGTSSAFSIVLTLTVASLIHVVHAIGQRQRHLKFQRSRAVILAAFRKLTVPVLLAHFTTAVGFLSLNWADAPSFQAMGNLVAVGLIFSLLLSLFVAPIVFKSKRRELYVHDDRIRVASMWFARIWAAAPLRAGAIVSTLSAVALLGLVNIQFDDQLTRFFPEDHWLRVNI
ncbi:MAG TPA: MMPL family transporter, partial [Paracoccaceae bacterium]|nr:MMPL family transporter [Paracoccaceae bacterium]